MLHMSMRQVGIDECGFGAAMTEQSLQSRQVNAVFDQVRGIGMTQGMDGCLFENPALFYSRFKSFLHGAVGIVPSS